MALPKQGDVTDAEIEESKPSQGQSVQVDLKEEEPKGSPKPADGKAQEAPATSPDRSAEERRLKALESQVAATRRINEDLKREVATLRQERQTTPPAESGAQVLPKGTAQETVDKYDQLVSNNRWQEAVRLLAREEARSEYKSTREIEQATEQVRYVEQRRLTALERSKQKVEATYPSLHRDTGNQEAVETQLFNQAVAELSTEDEEFIHSPHAPELAMRRMEEMAQERGIALTRSAVRATPKTATRGNQTSMPASRGPGGATTYTMTPEQKTWADQYLGHLPEGERYKHYARYAKAVETTGGVET